MSDEDDFYSEESYEFEFEDGDDDDNLVDKNSEVDDYAIENNYYTAKGIKSDNPTQALVELRKVITSANDENIEQREWVFKAYKQIIKILYKQHSFDEMLAEVDPMLRQGAKLTPNYLEESLAKMLARYTTEDSVSGEFIGKFTDKILEFVSAETGFTRIWFRANLTKLAAIDAQNMDSWKPLVERMNERMHSIADGATTTYALELLAVEVDLYSQQSQVDLEKLSELYQRSLLVNTAVAHPKVVGTVNEAGAQVSFYRSNYEKARLLFYDCFKNYDEVGSPKKRTVLKYLALCAMLSENEFNPFESQETQAYSQLPEYHGLMQMLDAYDRADIDDYKRVVAEMEAQGDSLAADPIFHHANPQILENLVAKTLINVTKAFKSVSFATVCKFCHIDSDRLQQLVLELVTQGKLSSVKLDYIGQYLITEEPSESMFLPTLDGQAIYSNMKVLSTFSIAPPSLDDVDMESNGLDTWICPGGDKPRGEWISAAEKWLEHVKSVAPAPIKSEMSQKDQVVSKQKQQQLGADDGGEEEDDEIEESDLLSEKVSKIDVLSKWANSVNLKLDQLTQP